MPDDLYLFLPSPGHEGEQWARQAVAHGKGQVGSTDCGGIKAAAKGRTIVVTSAGGGAGGVARDGNALPASAA